MIWWISRALSRIDTARRQGEAKLHESEQRYRSIFECSRDAHTILAPPSWKSTFANPATLELFGAKDTAEFTALGPWELSPEIQPDGRPSAEKAMEMIETASFGVADHEGRKTPEELVQATDEALYRAKAAGRNCVKGVEVTPVAAP